MINPLNFLHNKAKSLHTVRLKVIASVITIFLVILIYIFTPLIFHGLKAASYGTLVYSQAYSLLDNIKKKEWQVAVDTANSLTGNLHQLNIEINHLGPLSHLPKIKNDVLVVSQFVGVAESLAESYLETFKIFATLEKSGLAVDPSNLLADKNLLTLISQDQVQLDLAQKNITEASRRFAAINTNEFNGFFAPYLIKAHGQIDQILSSTSMALPAIGLLPDLLGYHGEKHYLLVFENNMELRPTGGFIGSYGIITVKNGEIENIFTDDVYNLDKLSEGKLFEPAPRPMTIYNKQALWYMRDANFAPAWPDSAKKIVDFFHIERRNANLSDQSIDGVIAITPDFIANLLEVLGPIETHGITFSATNFAMDLEKFVEGGFEAKNIPYEERKSIIGVLSKTIISRMETTSATDFTKLWLAFKKNIDQKNILVYMFDDHVQKYFSDQNWAGEIRQTDGDYLMLIDSNFASLKTDAVMERAIKRSLTINKNGDLLAHLEITYHHNGQFVKNLITRYRTYAKVYVPQGTWFESGMIKDENGETNLDMLQDLEYGTENNKTFVTYFLIIEPGTSKTMILNYKLPAYLQAKYENGDYSLLVQKQPGTSGHKLGIDLNLNQEISAYQSAELPSNFHGQTISWDSDLMVDREFKLKL